MYHSVRKVERRDSCRAMLGMGGLCYIPENAKLEIIIIHKWVLHSICQVVIYTCGTNIFGVNLMWQSIASISGCTSVRCAAILVSSRSQPQFRA